MDGWITIGTELNTNDFEKQLEKTQRKLKQLTKQKLTDLSNHRGL